MGCFTRFTEKETPIFDNVDNIKKRKDDGLNLNSNFNMLTV